MASLTPWYSKSGNISNVRYDLPHSILSSAVYPIRAPNGSAIIIYGHETGIRVVWQGGNLTTNHQKNDITSGLDSSASIVAEESEFDPFEPYPHVIGSVDVHLASGASKLSVPPLTATGFETAHVPPLLRKNIVVAVACLDGDVRLVSLPLLPPPSSSSLSDNPRSDDRTKSQSTTNVIHFGGPQGHQDLISDLSITWTATRNDDSDEDRWHLLLASCSADGGGLLLLFASDVQHIQQTTKPQAVPYLPIQRVRLSSVPLKIRFNTCAYPSRRHSLLMISDQAGAVRIYDPLSVRPSSNTRITANSQKENQNQEHKWPHYGSWLVSYVTPYNTVAQPNSSSPSLAQPKQILDIEWALEGTGIIALLADGEWGLWRQDFAKNDDQKLVSQAGSRFVLTGRLDASTSQSLSGSGVGGAKVKPALLSYTPNARKAKQMQLFGIGPDQEGATTGAGGSSTAAAHMTRRGVFPSVGGVSVGRNISASGDSVEESVVLWYGEFVFGIPNFDSYWTRFGGREGSIGLQHDRSEGVFYLEHTSLDGDVLKAISTLPRSSSSSASAARVTFSSRTPSANSWGFDLLLQGERRFGIWSNTNFSLRQSFVPYFPDEQSMAANRDRDEWDSAPTTGGGARGSGDSISTMDDNDRTLLAAGELGLPGIDRELERMEARSQRDARGDSRMMPGIDRVVDRMGSRRETTGRETVGLVGFNDSIGGSSLFGASAFGFGPVTASAGGHDLLDGIDAQLDQMESRRESGIGGIGIGSNGGNGRFLTGAPTPAWMAGPTASFRR